MVKRFGISVIATAIIVGCRLQAFQSYHIRSHDMVGPVSILIAVMGWAPFKRIKGYTLWGGIGSPSLSYDKVIIRPGDAKRQQGGRVCMKRRHGKA